MGVQTFSYLNVKPGAQFPSKQFEFCQGMTDVNRSCFMDRQVIFLF